MKSSECKMIVWAVRVKTQVLLLTLTTAAESYNCSSTVLLASGFCVKTKITVLSQSTQYSSCMIWQWWYTNHTVTVTSSIFSLCIFFSY